MAGSSGTARREETMAITVTAAMEVSVIVTPVRRARYVDS